MPGRPWTERQEILLLLNLKRGLTVPEIGVILKRSPNAIYKRAAKLHQEGHLAKPLKKQATNICPSCKKRPKEVLPEGSDRATRAYCSVCRAEKNAEWHYSEKGQRVYIRGYIKRHGTRPRIQVVNHDGHKHKTDRERQKCRNETLAREIN